LEKWKQNLIFPKKICRTLKNFFKTGFERIKDSAHQLIEKIKNLIIVKISELDIDENFFFLNF
jgi:hypothetical protein